MKTKPRQLGRWAGAILLCSLILLPSALAQDCPCSWYDAVPPNPAWGLPPTLREILPCHFYDTEEVEAGFLVPLAGLQSLLPPGIRALEANAEVSPWKYLGPSVSGLGVLFVTFAENKSNQYVGSFNQVFTTVMVDGPSWSTGVSAWCPVTWVTTSEASRWVGSAIWGFAEIVGDTHFQSVKPKGTKAFSSADGELIMKMEVDTSDMVPAPFPPIVTVSSKDGYLVRAPMYATAGTRVESGTIGASTLKLGEHPIAQQLRAIGLGMYPSIWQTRSWHMQVTMEAGTCEPLPGLSSN